MAEHLTRWLQRWEEGVTGWHLDTVNPNLEEFADPGWSRVLVPLCGASVDMAWLAGRGVDVVGVDISPRAAQRVFEDAGMLPTRTRVGGFECFRAGNLSVFVGDAFDLDADVVGRFDGVWDRAALIAVFPEHRDRYLAALRRVADGASLRLVSLEYPEAAFEGPPFSIQEPEIRRLLGEVRTLESRDVSDFARARGLDVEVRETIYAGRL